MCFHTQDQNSFDKFHLEVFQVYALKQKADEGRLLYGQQK